MELAHPVFCTINVYIYGFVTITKKAIKIQENILNNTPNKPFTYPIIANITITAMTAINKMLIYNPYL